MTPFAVFKFPDPGRFAIIESDIVTHGQFTDVYGFGAGAWDPGDFRIGLLCTRSNTLSHVAIAQRKNLVAKEKYSVSFFQIAGFTPLDLSELTATLAAGKHAWTDAYDGFMFQTQEAWNATIDIIKSLRPDIYEAIKRLEAKLTAASDEIPDAERQVLDEEGDSVGIALDIAGIKRDAVLQSWTPKKRNDGRFNAFLAGIDEAHLTEEDEITHDSRTFFRGWKCEELQICAAAKFTQGDRQVLMFNANRNGLEKTLGVDLLWIDTRFNCFIMVQYKRLTARDGKLGYYPNSDNSYVEELNRMEQWENSLADRDPAHFGDERDFRLLSNPFYFKICKPYTRTPFSSDLIEGMYFSLPHWKSIMRVHKKVSEQNAYRWLSNTEFTTLAHKGWIGTAGRGTELAYKVLTEALKHNRSVTVGELHHL